MGRVEARVKRNLEIIGEGKRACDRSIERESVGREIIEEELPGRRVRTQTSIDKINHLLTNGQQSMDFDSFAQMSHDFVEVAPLNILIDLRLQICKNLEQLSNCSFIQSVWETGEE